MLSLSCRRWRQGGQGGGFGFNRQRFDSLPNKAGTAVAAAVVLVRLVIRQHTSRFHPDGEGALRMCVYLSQRKFVARQHRKALIDIIDQHPTAAAVKGSMQ